MDYGDICSGGSALQSEAECQTAAAALGLSFALSYDGPGDFPACFHTKDDRDEVNNPPSHTSLAHEFSGIFQHQSQSTNSSTIQRKLCCPLLSDCTS